MSNSKRRSGARATRQVRAARPAVGRDELLARARAQGLIQRSADGNAEAPVVRGSGRPMSPPTVGSHAGPTTIATEPPVVAPGQPAVPAHGTEGLCATAWFDVTPHEPPVRAVRFTGRRMGGSAAAEAPVEFDRVVHLPSLPADVGRVSVSALAQGIAPGTWDVRALALTEAEPGVLRPAYDRRHQQSQVVTGLSVLQHAPGVTQWAWPALVALGTAVALVVQALLLREAGGDVRTGLVLATVATMLGYLSAKAYYMVQHRRSVRTFVTAGTCIQGFLLGAGLTLVVGASLTSTEPLTLMDATAPGVLLAMAVGRPGCWFGGCCAGRPTSSRLGLWASDRAVGVRRVPVQLMEAGVALVLGVATLLAALDAEPPSGTLTLAGFGAYTASRQILFRWRSQARRSTRTQTVVLVTSASLAAVATGAMIA